MVFTQEFHENKTQCPYILAQAMLVKLQLALHSINHQHIKSGSVCKSYRKQAFRNPKPRFVELLAVESLMELAHA
jgi:hypothetical protein